MWFDTSRTKCYVYTPMQLRLPVLLCCLLLVPALLPSEALAQRFGFQTIAHVNRPDFAGSEGLILWATRDFTTFGLGWRGELHLNQDWSIQAGLDYNNFQYMFTTTYEPAAGKGPEADYRHYLQMQEFQIPIMLRHNFHYKDSLVFYAMVGLGSRAEPHARMTVRPSDNNKPVYQNRIRLPIVNRKPWGTLLAGVGMEIRGVHKRIKPFFEFNYREIHSLYYYNGTDDGGIADQLLTQRLLQISIGLAL